MKSRVIFWLATLLLSMQALASEKTWQAKQIEEVFVPFKDKKISWKQITAFDKKIKDKKILWLVRFEVVDKKLYSSFVKSKENELVQDRYRILVSKFRKWAEQGLIPNTTFLFLIADSIIEEDNVPHYQKVGKDHANNVILAYQQFASDTKQIKNTPNFPPIFVIAKNSYTTFSDKFLLGIDDYVIGNKLEGVHLGLEKIVEEIEQGVKQYPWRKKTSKAVWRGSVTDCKDWKEEYCHKHSSRMKLVEIAKSNKNINAHLSYVPSVFFDGTEHYLSRMDQVKYKYQINMDGITATYPGFAYRLLSNSVVLKQESADVQWFYKALKPYVHYVPIKHDLSDLEEKIKWLQKNDKAAKEIATNAREFALKNLMPKDFDNYQIELINRFTKQLSFEVKKPTLRPVEAY